MAGVLQATLDRKKNRADRLPICGFCLTLLLGRTSTRPVYESLTHFFFTPESAEKECTNQVVRLLALMVLMPELLGLCFSIGLKTVVQINCSLDFRGILFVPAMAIGRASPLTMASLVPCANIEKSNDFFSPSPYARNR